MNDAPEPLAGHPTLDERRLALEERKAQWDHELRAAELALKRTENSRFGRLSSPLTATILAGIVTFAASAVGTYLQGRNSLDLERSRFEATRHLEESKFETTRRLEAQKEQHELILKMISVGDEKQARANIEFLAESGLLTDGALATRLLAAKVTGVLPSTSTGTRPGSRAFQAVRTDEEMIDLVIAWEASTTDAASSDPQQATNGGITLAALSTFLDRPATVDELRQLPRAVMREFYKRRLEVSRADQIEVPQVRAAYLNIDVAAGRVRASRVLQLAAGKVLGRDVTPDGTLGPVSLSLINSVGDADLLVETANCLHLEYLKTLDAYPTFGQRWVERARAFSPVALRGVCPELAPAAPGAAETGRAGITAAK